MPGWNLADIWEAVARDRPDATALIHGRRRAAWADFERRAAAVARRLVDAGLPRQAKVAQYLTNCPEYLESVFACFKASLVPVNTNYRYVDDELVHLWDNADAEAVVFSGSFVERVEAVRPRVPRVTTWLWVDDSTGPCPPWAEPYEAAAATDADGWAPPWERDGGDLFFIYTGGTTGTPKGVMWRQDDLVALISRTGGAEPLPDGGGPDDVRERLATRPSLVVLSAAPLMHGTGILVSFATLLEGSSVATLTSRHLDVVELLDTVERERVNVLVIVGDAFGRPIVDALDAEPGRWDLSSLLLVLSSGAMWSEPVRARLLAHNPTMVLSDNLGSSEALGMGAALSEAAAGPTASFRLGTDAVVLDDDGTLVEPGSGRVGRLAVRGRLPVGYYKDPVKTAATFPVIDGERYSVPGDYATVETDGSLTLLGRGSVCINSGGEKVFPEEVEEALKTHPTVRDAVAVGVPDDRFGEVVVAMVEPEPEEGEPDETTLVTHVRGRLAAYKAPRRVLAVDSIARAPNGKADYRRWREYAARAVVPTR